MQAATAFPFFESFQLTPNAIFTLGTPSSMTLSVLSWYRQLAAISWIVNWGQSMTSHRGRKETKWTHRADDRLTVATLEDGGPDL